MQTDIENSSKIESPTASYQYDNLVNIMYRVSKELNMYIKKSEVH